MCVAHNFSLCSLHLLCKCPGGSTFCPSMSWKICLKTLHEPCLWNIRYDISSLSRPTANLWMFSLLSQVIEKLKALFSGYDNFPPTAMVLMGNFLSSKQGSQLSSTLKAKFKLLAELLAQYPNLVANTRFVVVPGPQDCLTANILPRYVRHSLLCYFKCWWFSISLKKDKF